MYSGRSSIANMGYERSLGLGPYLNDRYWDAGHHRLIYIGKLPEAVSG